MKLDLVIVVLLLGHLLGEFIFQAKAADGNKPVDYRMVVKRSLLYAAGILLGMMFFMQSEIWIPIIIVIVSHIVMEIMHALLPMKGNRTGGRTRLAVEQCLHLLVLLGAAYWIKNISSFGLNGIGIMFQDWLRSVISVADVERLLRLLLLAVGLSKPANMLIKLFLSKFSYESAKPGLTDAGQVIGTLERYVVAFFVILQQYAAIGLVFTAKSIARYNKISEDPEFAEYYLVGSLLSVLTAVVSTVFVYQIYN